MAACLKGHPNIVRVEDYRRDQPITLDGESVTRDVMVMEHCPNGDLYDFMNMLANKGHKGLYSSDQSLLRALYGQLLCAVDAVHTQAGVAHLDLKLENILISDKGILKLCDFGFSSFSKDVFITKKLGTDAYMAPEVHEAFQTPFVGKTADIFSLGVLFFILAFGSPPFHVAQKSDIYFKFLKMKPGSCDFFKHHPHTRKLYRDGELD